MPYQRLTQDERYQISAYQKAGFSCRYIASQLNRAPSTIYRELKRNRGQRGYFPKLAHQKAADRQKAKPHYRLELSTWNTVRLLLAEKWSPEQIRHWLANTQQIAVSHESIYQYVLADKRTGGHLFQNLRCQKKRRKRYGSGRNRRGEMKHRVSIEERPAIVDARSRIGDWEVDTIVGGHQGSRPVLVTLIERYSRLCLIAKSDNKSAQAISETLQKLLIPLKNKVLTMTYDNGPEFAQHAEVSKALQAEAYFAHPYCSWERGANENMNGLIRQYCPKKTDFGDVSDQKIQAIADALNNRPRKCLGWRTPNQVMFGIDPPVALAT